MRSTRRATARLLAPLLAVGLLAACGDDDGDTVTADDDTTTTTAPEPDEDDTSPDGLDAGFEPTEEQIAIANEVLERDAPDVEGTEEDVAPDALDVTTVIEGDGPGAEVGDLIVAHYAGVLADGTPFDDSWSRQQPFELQLGAGMVITGWDEGLVGARAGERRRLVIGYENAYGAQGRPPTIPAEATLVFEIDVVAIIPAGV
jgi:FKBP-type peptidyl-prolyl cis-trans isomerase